MKLFITNVVAIVLVLVEATRAIALPLPKGTSPLPTGDANIANTSSVELDFGRQHPNPQTAAPDRNSTIEKPETSDNRPSGIPDFRPPTPATTRTPKLKSQSSKPVKGVTKAIASSIFATKKSRGSIAVGAAEGNLTVTGKITSLYSGHVDPGNHVTNRGFCSWNRAQNLTVAEADRRCLAALQRQSAATEQKLTALALDAGTHTEALVNGADLWNQSNSAGPQFAIKYKQALNKGLKGSSAYIWARVEAFRNQSGVLDASGLFGICAREPYYQRRLSGIKPYSEAWRWQCIALDQRRRVRVVGKVLEQGRVGEWERGRGGEGENSFALPETNQQRDRSFTSVALNFEPVVTGKPGSSYEESTGTHMRRERELSENYLPNFRTNRQPLPPITPSPPQPLTSGVLSFDPFLENNGKVVKPSNEQVGALPLDTNEMTGLGIDEREPSRKTGTGEEKFSSRGGGDDAMTPDLKKIPKKGDKIAGYAVTSPYGTRIHPIFGRSHFHGGVDLATPTNTNVYAIGKPGTKTTLQCWIDGKGGGLVATMTSPSFPSLKFDALHLTWCISIPDRDSHRTTSATTGKISHSMTRGVIDSNENRYNGSKILVDAGEIIGGTGNTGHSTGPHLHFQVRNAKTGDRIPPSKGHIWWVLTGKVPKKS